MSEDPVRLFDDPTAPSALRDDLERAARAPGPAYDEAAGLARLSTAIGALPPPAGPAPAPPGAGGAAAGGAGKAVASGILWAFVAGGVAGGALMLILPGESPRPAPVPAYPAVPAADRRPAAPIPSALPRPVELAPAATAPAQRPVPAREASEPPRAQGAGGSSVAAPPSNELAQEMQHLAALRAATRADPTRAVELAAAGQRRFASGVFGEEREALAIKALARAGRADESRSRAQAFLARHPSSAFAEEVRQAAGL